MRIDSTSWSLTPSIYLHIDIIISFVSRCLWDSEAMIASDAQFCLMHACGGRGVVGRCDECLTQLILIYHDEETGFLSRFRFLSDPDCVELSHCLPLLVTLEGSTKWPIGLGCLSRCDEVLLFLSVSTSCLI